MSRQPSGFLRLGVAGMRGVVGSALDPLKAINYASALGTYLDGGTVVIARDTRRSSLGLSMAVESALLDCGCDIIDIGVAPAPLAHFLVKDLKASGGMLVGAGHHPAGWNALVPLNADGAYFNSVETQSMLDIYHSRLFRKAGHLHLGRLTSPPPAPEDRYLAALLSRLDVEVIRHARFRVVADFCNGSGTRIGIKLAKALGVELIPLNDEQSGYLPHEPEPRPRTAKQVQALMKPLKANAGFVFNSDASRVSIVTDEFETLSEELTYPLAARHILGKLKDGLILTNICSSRRLDRIAAEFNAELIKVEVGQAVIMERMADLGADLAGDGSGSVAFNDGVAGFDALMTMAVILEAIAASGQTASQLVRQMPYYYIVKRMVPCGNMSLYNVEGISEFFGQGATVDETDGLRFDWPDGWAHFRISLTEPIIRIIVECETRQKAETLADKAVKAAERVARGS